MTMSSLPQQCWRVYLPLLVVGARQVLHLREVFVGVVALKPVDLMVEYARWIYFRI